jgi:hypothetical protein
MWMNRFEGTELILKSSHIFLILIEANFMQRDNFFLYLVIMEVSRFLITQDVGRSIKDKLLFKKFDVEEVLQVRSKMYGPTIGIWDMSWL